jgi:cytochrome c-type biogenesis protein CcmH/NrfF
MPVHERAVKCPHCGGATGVSADASLTAEERRAAVDLARAEAERNLAGDPFSTSYADNYRYDPELALVGGVALAAAAVGVVVKTAAAAVIDERRERRDRPELPRATARERTAPPIAPEPSTAPEPALPPSDTPRFLK